MDVEAKLKEAGFSDNNVVTIMNIINGVCELCWEGDVPDCPCQKEEV